MEIPKDWAVASVDLCEKPQRTGVGNVESTTDWTWKEQANYNTQRDIDKKKAQQSQSTQVAELMGRQQQVNIVSHGNHVPQAQVYPQIFHPQQGYQTPQQNQQQQVYQPPQLHHQQQFSNWQWDQAGHYYQQLYDNNAQQWYTVWWDYNEGRVYRTLKDEYGQ